MLTGATTLGGKGWTITDGGKLTCGRPFIMTRRTTEANEMIGIPKSGAGYLYQIDWGDGSPLETSNNATLHTHTYAVPGDYQVSIVGSFPRLYIANNATYRNKLIAVNQR